MIMENKICIQCGDHLIIFGEFQSIQFESPAGLGVKTPTAGYCEKPECPNYRLLQAM